MVISDEKAKLYDNIIGALLINFYKRTNTHNGFVVNMDVSEKEAAKFLYHFLLNMKPILDKNVTVYITSTFSYIELVLTKQIRKNSRVKNMDGCLYINNPYSLLEEFFKEIGYNEETPWQELIVNIYNVYYSLEKNK